MLLTGFSVVDVLVVLVVALMGTGFSAWLLVKWVKTQLPTLQSAPAAVAAPSIEPAKPKGPLARKCGNCKHFDLVAGRAAMEQWPAFVLATKYRTPAQMYNTEASPDNVPVTAKWTDFGACGQHAEVRFEGDKCEHYEERVEA